jgi:hypothetical protein
LGDEDDVDDEESRRNFAREAPESSVSVSVQVSSSSTKNSAINQQQQQQQVAAAAVDGESATPTATTATTATVATATAADSPFTAKPLSLPQPPPADDADPNGGDLYEDEYEESEGDEEFFKDVPKVGQDRRRRYALGDGRRA